MSIFRVRNLLIQVLEPLECGNDSACNQDVSALPGKCDQASAHPCVESAVAEQKWACGCSLHFDTTCQIWRFSLVCRYTGLTLECVPGGVTFVNREEEVATEPCPDPNSGCQVLVSLPLCPKITDTGCDKIVNSGVIMDPPVGVCFRSDEPRLNPNSLADLGVLRRQLALGMEIVQRRESALLETLTPQTEDQVNKAEAILRAALEDLNSTRQHVQSRALASRKTSTGKKSTAKKAAPMKNRAGK